MTKESIKLALEALEKTALIFGDDSLSSKAAAALQEALAEQTAQQETMFTYDQVKAHIQAAIMSSAQRTWVGLTDDEIMDMYNEPRSDAEMIAFGREVEAKLRSKNT